MKRIFSAALTLILVFALFAGCNGQENTGTQVPEATSAPSAPAETAVPTDTEPPDDPESMYPITDDEVELTLWHHFSPSLASAGVMESYSEHPVFQAAEEATGVHIEFIECHISARADQFAVMIATGEYPDMFRCFSTLYGSITKGVEDEIILPLDDYVEIYAPDYLAVAATSESWQKAIYEDDGHISQFKSFVTEGGNDQTNGLMMRADWLEELELEIPVTYEEYHDVLTIFKTEYDISDPVMLIKNSTMAGFAQGLGTWAYMTSSSGATASQSYFFQVDGQIVSTLTSPEYLEYVTLVHQYYEEGLVSPDWMTNEEDTTSESYNALITTGQCGMWSHNASFVDSLYEQAAQEGFEIVPVVGPVRSEGDSNLFTAYSEPMSSNALSISTQCETPEIAVAWCNFWFTELGSSLVDYGVEGLSWEWGDDGQKHFTELVTNNPDMTLTVAMNYYALGVEWTGVRSSDYIRMRDTYSDITRTCIDTWTAWRDDTNTRSLPTLSLTSEESEEFNSLYADISTYADESIAKFITGDLSLSQWDTFVETLQEMGIEQCVAIYQAALDRYNAK